MHPKIQAIFYSILCIVLAIVLYFFTDLNIIYIIDILIFGIFFIILIFVTDKFDLCVSPILFYIILLIPLALCSWFDNSSLAMNISIADWEQNVYYIAKNNCKEKCTIHNRSIYNSDNIELYKWIGGKYVYSGFILYKNNDISYELCFENKCISKQV